MSLIQQRDNTLNGDTLHVKGVTMAAKPFRHCIFVLDELLSCYDCFQFLAPVPLTAVVYHTEVKNPMDFKTLEYNLYQNRYQDYQDFVQDLCLIWDNAKLFHRSFDLIYQQAENLKKRYTGLSDFIQGGPKPFYLSTSSSDIDLILQTPLPEERIIINTPLPEPEVIFPMYKEMDPPNKSNLYFVQALSEEDCNTKKLRGFSNVRLLFQHLNASFFEYMSEPSKYNTVPLPRFYIAKNRTLLNEAGTDPNGALAVLYNVQIKPLTRDLYRLQATVVMSEPMGETHGFDESSMDKSDEYEFCPKAWLKLRVIKVVENVNTVINTDMDRSFFKKVYNTYKLSTKVPGDLKKVGDRDIAKEFVHDILNPVSASKAMQQDIDNAAKNRKPQVVVKSDVAAPKLPKISTTNSSNVSATNASETNSSKASAPNALRVTAPKSLKVTAPKTPKYTTKDVATRPYEIPSHSVVNTLTKSPRSSVIKGKSRASASLSKVKEEPRQGSIYETETIPVIEIRSPATNKASKSMPAKNIIRITPPVEKKNTELVKKDTKPVKIDTEPVKKDTEPLKKDSEPVKKDTELVKKDTEPTKKDNEPVEIVRPTIRLIVTNREPPKVISHNSSPEPNEWMDVQSESSEDEKKNGVNEKSDVSEDNQSFTDEDDESYMDAVSTSPVKEIFETTSPKEEETQLTETSVSFERYMEDDNKDIQTTELKGYDADKQYYIDASKELWQKLRDYAKEKDVPVVDISTYIDKTSSYPNAEGFFKHVYFLREDSQKVVQTFRRMTITQRTTEIASLLALKGLPHMGQITEVLQESHGEIIGLSMQRYEKTLKQYTHAHSHHRLTAHQKMDLIIQMLQCIEIIHSAGLAHRDLSEVNFMVNETNETLRDGSRRAELFLIDFGKSTFTDPEDVRRWWIEHPKGLHDEYDGEIVPLTKEDLNIWCQQLPWIRSKPDHGYRLYRSVQTLPKNRTDTEDLPWLVNPLSEDIYSIGTIIWKTFSETEPWYGILDTDLKGLRETVGEDYHIERALQREVPGKLSKELLLKFLKVSPEHRKTATQVLAWLDDIHIQDGLIAEWEEHAPVGRQKRHAKALFRYDDEQAASTDLTPQRKKQKSNGKTLLQLHIPARSLSPVPCQSTSPVCRYNKTLSPSPRKLAPRPEYSSNSGRNHLSRDKRQEDDFNYYKSS